MFRVKTINILWLFCLPTLGPANEKLTFFETRIRPIFVERCYNCHSREAARHEKLKGGFYIDMREGLLRGGESGPAVIPGQPDKSLLMKVIRHEIIEMQMPPKKKKLTDEQIMHIETWIKDGCVDSRTGEPPRKEERVIDFEEARTFWSFSPLKAQPPPSVKNQSWVKNPIDRFILEKLEAKNIPVAPAASRETLIRRAYLSLTGLAPGQAQVKAFTERKDPGAWTRLVDELLASPHFGERWGRHWLDLARFAESNGYAFDKDRKGAFHYRDFVVKALNQDMPYDEFVRLQLAGDLIDDKRYDHLAATGFIAAGPFTSQQTAKERERSRYEQLDDLISTVGTAMLGLSVGCARCHDHKFDPITAKDYYRMITAFERAGFQTEGVDFEPEKYAAAKKAFDLEHQPLVEKRKAYEAGDLKTAAQRFQKKWSSREVDQAMLAGMQKTWEASQVPLIKQGGIKSYPIPIHSAVAKEESVIKTDAAGISLVTGANPANNTYTLEGRMTGPTSIAGLMLDVFTDPSLAAKGPGRASNGNFVLSNFLVEINGKPIKLIATLADFSQNGYPIAHAVDDNPRSGWAISGGIGKDHGAAFKLEERITSTGELKIKIILDQQYGSSHTIGKFRIRALSDFPKAIEDIGRAPALPGPVAKILLKEQRSQEDEAAIKEYFLTSAGSAPFISQAWRYHATKEVIDVSSLKLDALDETWKSQTWEDGKNVNTVNGYAYRRLDALSDFPVELNLKINGHAEAWLNGKVLFSQKNADFKQENKRHFFLQKGRNDLVLKLDAKNDKPGLNFSLASGLNGQVQPFLERSDLKDEDLQILTGWYGPYDATWQALNRLVLDHEQKAPKPQLTDVYRAKKNGRTYGRYDIHHLVRGNSDAKLKRATPGFMEVLMRSGRKEQQWLQEKDKTEPRVAFARWITDEKLGAGNLLARVLVNRIWKHHMGRGLVSSVSNFGKTGEPPTHPELLDWLAQTLIDNKWSQKSIHRLILSSSAYQQGVAVNNRGEMLDPDNTLLWTRRKQRIEAEVIRDRLLQLSGLLDKRMFGQGTLNLKDPRRSIYLTVKRSKLLPFLQLFDAPDAIEGKALRTETASAPQSLTLMNSPFVREMSVKLAGRIESESGEDFIRQAYWEILSREPRAEETAYLTKFLADQAALYEKDQAAAKKAAIDLCQLLICSNEFVYID